MERNLRMWDDDDDDDSREASSKVGHGGSGGDHVTDGFATSGGGAGNEALRNSHGRGEANTSSRVFWITTSSSYLNYYYFGKNSYSSQMNE